MILNDITIVFPNLWEHNRLAALAVFSIWQSLQVLQKTCIEIVAHAIYIYLFFYYTYTLFFCWIIKTCCDNCFPLQIRPQTTVQWYISRDYSSVRTGFNMINKRHILLIVYPMFFKICQVSIIIVLLRVTY